MDTVTGSTKLYNKIMAQIPENKDLNKIEPSMSDRPTAFTKKNNSYSATKVPAKRTIIGLVAMTTVAAAILMGVLYIPGLLNRPAEIIIDEEIPFIAAEVSSEPDDTSIHATEIVGNELIFNMNQVASTLLLDVNSRIETTMELSQEQATAAFPSLEIPFEWMGAAYGSHGDFIEIQANQSPLEWRDFNRPISPRTLMRVSDVELPIFMEFIIQEGPAIPYYSYIAGVPIMIMVYEGIDQGVPYDPPFPIVHFRVNFQLSGIFYLIEVRDDYESGRDFIAELLPQLIAGGPANLWPVIDVILPSILPVGNVGITLEEAQQDDTFGHFVPRAYPIDIPFEWANRYHTEHGNHIRLQWGDQFGDQARLHMWIGTLNEIDEIHTVSAWDYLAFDWRAYPPRYTIPWREAIYGTPAIFTIPNPVFLAEDLTFDMILARAYIHEEDTNDWPTEFSVFHERERIVIYIYAYGVDPETIWAMLSRR